MQYNQYNVTIQRVFMHAVGQLLSWPIPSLYDEKIHWDPARIWTWVFSQMLLPCNWATGALALEQRVGGIYIHRHSSILRLDLFLYSAWLVSKQLTVLSTEVLFCCNHSELGIGSNFAWVSGEMHFAFGQSVCTVCVVCVCVWRAGGGGEGVGRAGRQSARLSTIPTVSKWWVTPQGKWVSGHWS